MVSVILILHTIKFHTPESCHTVTVYKSTGYNENGDSKKWGQGYYLIKGKPPPGNGYKPPMLPMSGKN